MPARPNEIQRSQASSYSRNRNNSGLGRYFLPVSVLLIVIAVVSVAWELDRMSRSHVHSTALRDAAAYNEAISEFRSLYTTEVVGRLKDHHIDVVHNYQDREAAIPLPATLTQLLGDRLGGKASECSTRLFSDYPFPWREQGGSRDDFEREALKALRHEPSQPYYRFEEYRGQPTIRYATADLMVQSCVNCHNSHPESPKTDWEVGDVRGVLSVNMPLAGSIATARSEVFRTMVTLTGVGGAIVGLFIVTLVLLKRHSLRTALSNERLAARTRELKVARDDLQTANDKLQSNAVGLTRSRRAALNLMQDMRQAKEAAEKANLSKSQFLANMSHEIRTPMTAILGFAETLEESISKPEHVEAIHTIRRNGEHLLGIINDILDLSKIEAEKFSIEILECSIHELLVEVEKLMQVRADAKGIKWSVNLDNALPDKIKTDPTRLRQILINLVGNAIKFTEVGFVRLNASVVQDGDDWLFTFQVCDSGIGMSEHQRGALFQPFTQADDSMSRKFGGTGLGLTISKRFSEMLGGDIAVESAPGKGSVFSLTIKAEAVAGSVMCDQLQMKPNSPREANGQNAFTDLSGLRILLVEDGPDNQRLISFVLRKAGAIVDVADNGLIGRDRAMQAMQNGVPYNVVLTDMQMPVMDGYTATRQLRELEYEGAIVALTAHAMAEDSAKCLAAGCDAFATKPIDRPKLLSLLYEFGTMNEQELKSTRRYVNGDASDLQDLATTPHT